MQQQQERTRYMITIKRSPVWTKISITRDGKPLLEDRAQLRPTTRKGLEFSAQKSFGSWYGRVPKPVRQRVLQQMRDLKKGQSWARGMVGNYIPERDNPRTQRVSIKRGGLRPVADHIPVDFKQAGAQIDLFS